MWFQYTLLTVLLWGSADLFYKKGNRQEEKYTHLKTLFTVGVALGIVGLVEYVKIGYDYDISKVITYLPVTSMYILSMAIGYFGLRYLEVSVSSPIQNTSGVGAAILTFLFLGKQMELKEFVLITILSLGILALAILEKKGDLELQEQIKKTDKKYISSKMAIIFPVLYMIIDAAGTFLDGFYLDENAPILTESESIISYGITFFCVGILAIVYMRIKGEKFILFQQRDRFIASTFEAVGQITYTYAMASNAIVAAPIISSYCLVSVLLGRVILKEKLSLLQYGVILVMVVCIAMLG